MKLLHLLLLAPSLLVAQLAAAETVPALKADVVVTGDIVRLGDLVENVPVSADQPVFRSPDIGTVGDVSTRLVLDAAKRLGVSDIDTKNLATISVRRASRVITVEAMSRAVEDAIVRQYGIADPDAFGVMFTSSVKARHIEPSLKGDVRVSQLNWSQSSGRFDATLEVPGSVMAQSSPIRVSGEAVETMNVTVFTRAIRPGEIIKSSDVMSERRPRSGIRSAVPMPEAIVGLAAKRALAAGSVVDISGLEKPRLIVRNTPVTLAFEIPGMTLAVRAKALEDGALGDAIAVVNAQSQRVVQAVVIGPGRVAILDSSRLASLN